MPATGGAADKLGNRYEALWVIDQILRIIDGTASELTLEPLDPDESRGIEFRVVNCDGFVDYWSVKRQTTKVAGWTLALLTAKDDRNRSILGDLLGHVERNTSYRGVFASMLGAPDFDELRMYATDTKMLNDRLDRSADLKYQFQHHILPLCGNEAERAREFLLRTRAHAADESQLRERVDFAIRKLFYDTNCSSVNTIAVRGYLCEFLLDNIHQPLRQTTILSALEPHGILRRDWAIETAVIDRIATLCKSYTEPLRSQLINGTFLQLNGADGILGTGSKPIKSKVLILGGAGGGKSCTLSAIVDKLCSARIPVIPIRFDTLPDSILTTLELGHKLGLPESPILVLAGMARGGPCALVVDQLDAVSIASGRRAEVWSLFDTLRREAERYPGLSIIVGCRSFDIEHDHRMRTLKAETSGFMLIEIRPLSPDQVDAVFREAGIAAETILATLKPVLAIPLHLSMYLTLSAQARVGVSTRDELFDRFWVEKERSVDQRQGSKTAWTAVIDKLLKWLSENQQLSAPKLVLDDYSKDAAAMASEHVLVLADDRYRFFHETFFDYAFARRFAGEGGRLTELLLIGEQHLFRRAQVRQVLNYLRVRDRERYLAELESTLLNSGIRFHIKSMVFKWMSSLRDPRIEEWKILQKVIVAYPEIRSHVRIVMTGNEGWFDLLNASGFFDSALASGDTTREEEIIWIFALPHILEKRSACVAKLLMHHRKSEAPWKQYFLHICRFGDVYHSPEMFNLFLSLIDDGTLDEARPCLAINDDWWSMLYSMAEKKPELACEAIGRWFDRVLSILKSKNRKDAIAEGEEPIDANLVQALDEDGDGARIILDAAKSARSYVEQMLPRIAELVNNTAKEYHDHLLIDPIWSFRYLEDTPHQVHSALLQALAQALETLARTDTKELDRLLTPYKDRPHDAISYLVLRAWAAAPETYADLLAEYLTSDPRRLKVGYSAWSSKGYSAQAYISIQALKAASQHCSSKRITALENVIVNLTDEWESKNPKFRGQRQLELLESFDSSRLSNKGRAKLDELRTKFPNYEMGVPEPAGGGFVGSPIPQRAILKMNDEHWLGAMRKYAGVEHRHDRPFEFSGGEYQLSQSLEEETKNEPMRFAHLAEQMEDTLPVSYFDAILRGVGNCISQKSNVRPSTIDMEHVIQLIRRTHRLPNHPCGQWIAYLIGKCDTKEWPNDIADIVAWYAVNHQDPKIETWNTLSESGQYYHMGDPYMSGINSVRGSAACALASMLFDKPERLEQLKEAIRSLSHDCSIAVRSCAVEPLLAMMNNDPSTAIIWFNECVAADKALLRVGHAERFISYASYRDYAAIRPVIQAMLNSGIEKSIMIGARQACLAALDIEVAKTDAERVRGGTPTMRKAAADVYSTNVAHKIVGEECRRQLKPFFGDAEAVVRTEAASAFRYISDLSTAMQADLLSGFIEAKPGKEESEPVIRALEDSPIQLPDLVCKFAEMCVDTFRNEAGDITKSGAAEAMDLSKIVIRLYAQTEDKAIQGRCLKLIDDMEQYHFLGLSDELQKLDR